VLGSEETRFLGAAYTGESLSTLNIFEFITEEILLAGDGCTNKSGPIKPEKRSGVTQAPGNLFELFFKFQAIVTAFNGTAIKK